MVDPRFYVKLHEQVEFIQHSAKLYDEGQESEAIRLAVSLRVLFHESPDSLVKLLGLNRSNILSSSRGHKDWRDYLSQEIDTRSSTPIRMKPMLGQLFREVPTEDWWKNETVFVHESKMFSRKKICLSAANQDGGAHVDKRLQEYYEVLSSGVYMLSIKANLDFNGNPPPFPQGVTIYPKNAHLALLRQFAHELLCTVEHYQWLKH